MHSRSHARQAARRGEEEVLLKWYPLEVYRDINVESVNNSVPFFKVICVVRLLFLRSNGQFTGMGSTVFVSNDGRTPLYLTWSMYLAVRSI
jgi:hypothetical protein